MKKKLLALLLVTSMVASVGCIKKEEPVEEKETISPELDNYYRMIANTNSCLELYPGQFYIWQNPKAESIRDDLLNSKEEIDERFKDYDTYVFNSVYYDTATFPNQSNSYGMPMFGAKNRVAWFTDESLVGVPTLYKDSKLIYYTNADVPAEFILEKFDYLGYSIGACGFDMDESQHCYIPLNYGGYYSESSSFYQVYSDIMGNENVKSTKLIVDNINNEGVSSDYIAENHNILLGLQPNEKYIFDIYYGTIHTKYELLADSLVLASALEGHHIITNYELYNSTVAVIDLPSDLQEGYYYVNNMGFFYYNPITQKEYEASKENATTPIEIESTIAE